MHHSAVQYYPMEVAASPDTIYTGPCKFYGLIIETDLTNDVAATVNDGAGGAEVVTFKCPGTDDSRSLLLPYPIQLTTGLEIALSGTGSRVVVLWGR